MTNTNLGKAAIHSLYPHAQPAGLCALREYLLVERVADTETVRLLFLRFLKECDFTVDSMTFTVTMLDAMGNELGTIPVTLWDSDIPPADMGQIFTPDVGIPVEGGCVDIRFSLTEVTSGDYLYRVEGTSVTTEYRPEEPWCYDPHAGESEKLTAKKSLRVRSKRSGKVRHLWPIALLSALLLVYFIAKPFWDALLDMISVSLR